jgi:organic hydroperoxide reductase OsmC/OhrA
MRGDSGGSESVALCGRVDFWELGNSFKFLENQSYCFTFTTIKQMSKEHHYQVNLEWVGNTGQGTANYRAYSRNYIISFEGKGEILCSSDPHFRGDASRYNPEELFVASLSSCHMLWYLHLCADAGVNVISYSDKPAGIMFEEPDGSGKFTEVSLYPLVVVEKIEMAEKANQLHRQAHKMCFIANSCNFPVKHFPECKVNA